MGVRYCMGVPSPTPLTKNLLIIDNARERDGERESNGALCCFSADFLLMK